MTNPQALEALRELVACKDLKDSAEATHFTGPLGSAGDGWLIKYEAQRKEYIRRQPAAWAAAREVLAATQPAPQPEARPEKFFSYGTDSGFDLHDTAKAAIEAAQTDIDQYRSDAMFDDEWSGDVESVCWGVVLGSAREVEVEPPDEDAADRCVDYRLTNATPALPDSRVIADAQQVAAVPVSGVIGLSSPAPAPLSEAKAATLKPAHRFYRESITVLSVCAAGRDGDCIHSQCPQLRDGEPEKTGHHCPLDSGLDGGM